MTFSVLDIVFLVVLLVFIISSAIKGFVGEIFGKLSFILGIFFAVVLNDKISVLLEKKITNEYLARILAFALVFIVVFVILKIVQVILQKVFEGKVLGSLDKALGILLGFLEGLVIISFVLYLMSVQPWFDFSEVLEQSFFYKMLSGIIKNSLSSIQGSSVPSETAIPEIK